MFLWCLRGDQISEPTSRGCLFGRALTFTCTARCICDMSTPELVGCASTNPVLACSAGRPSRRP